MKTLGYRPTLNDSFEFTYKGYDFELSNCVGAGNRDLDKRNILTDRYVCWMYGKRNYEGQTLEEYLELNPNESAEDNLWCPVLYLVPNAWSWGSEEDLVPGKLVNGDILERIDSFLEQNGGL